jgi:hypothetical protein
LSAYDLTSRSVYEGVYDLKCRSGRADHLSLSPPKTRVRWVFEPAGVAAEGDDFGVVEEPVEDGGGEDHVAEDAASFGEAHV